MIALYKKRHCETIIYFLNLNLIIMVKTKGSAQATANWEGAIGSVPAKYKTGVQGADNVIEKAIEAENLYAAKVQEAISKGSRVKGLQKTSTAEWKAKALSKGAARIATGMTESKDKFARGIGEVISVIEGVSIAPRTADPMANVDNRVKPIVAALAAMKK